MYSGAGFSSGMPWLVVAFDDAALFGAKQYRQAGSFQRQKQVQLSM